MNGFKSRRPSPAMVVALIALFVALGGTGYSATQFNRSSVATAKRKPPRHVDASQDTVLTKNLAPTLSVLSAKTAQSTASATHATDADRLGGSSPSAYLSHCPSGLKRAPGSNLCYEVSERPRVSWLTALATCALAGLHLPSPGELAQVFNDQGAVQEYQWTSNLSDGGGGLGIYAAVALSQNASRQITPENLTQVDTVPYRCVTEVAG